MSIKSTGIRLTERNKTRMKALIPNKSYNDVLEQLLDEVEQPKDMLDAALKKKLCKKFDIDENTPLETVVSSYLIDVNQKRIDVIKKTAWGSEFIEKFGTDEKTLEAIEYHYVEVNKVLFSNDGKASLGTVAAAIEALAIRNAVDHIKKGK